MSTGGARGGGEEARRNGGEILHWAGPDDAEGGDDEHRDAEEGERVEAQVVDHLHGAASEVHVHPRARRPEAPPPPPPPPRRHETPARAQGAADRRGAPGGGGGRRGEEGVVPRQRRRRRGSRHGGRCARVPPESYPEESGSSGYEDPEGGARSWAGRVACASTGAWFFIRLGREARRRARRDKMSRRAVRRAGARPPLAVRRAAADVAVTAPNSPSPPVCVLLAPCQHYFCRSPPHVPKFQNARRFDFITSQTSLILCLAKVHQNLRILIYFLQT